MSDEALRLLERIGSVRVRGEWHVRCLNGGFYDQQTRPCACDALRSFLVQPIPAAREAVLVKALQEIPKRMRRPKLVRLLADTSPAAEALLAQGERLRSAAVHLKELDDANCVGDWDGDEPGRGLSQDFAVALDDLFAALAPVCGTCKGSRIVTDLGDKGTTMSACPDCGEEKE
jgi:hypothetical protein